MGRDRTDIYYWKCDRRDALHGTSGRAADPTRLEEALGRALEVRFGHSVAGLAPASGQGNHRTFTAMLDGRRMFVRVEDGEDGDDYFAVDDQDTVISARSFEQIEGADLEFWRSSIARALRELRGYEVKSEIKTDAKGDKYILFVGERMRGKEPMRYEASCRIVTHCFSADEVQIVEVLGTKERMEKLDLSAMHQSVK